MRNMSPTKLRSRECQLSRVIEIFASRGFAKTVPAGTDAWLKTPRRSMKAIVSLVMRRRFLFNLRTFEPSPSLRDVTVMDVDVTICSLNAV